MNHIIAELLHPEIMGPPLERGTRYGHHFVVELISNGRRLVAVASEEGRKLLHEIEHGIGVEGADTQAVGIQSASGTVLVGDQSGTGAEPVSGESAGLPPTGEPNLPPQADGAAPTTTTGPANTFDS